MMKKKLLPSQSQCRSGAVIDPIGKPTIFSPPPPLELVQKMIGFGGDGFPNYCAWQRLYAAGGCMMRKVRTAHATVDARDLVYLCIVIWISVMINCRCLGQSRPRPNQGRVWPWRNLTKRSTVKSCLKPASHVTLLVTHCWDWSKKKKRRHRCM